MNVLRDDYDGRACMALSFELRHWEEIHARLLAHDGEGTTVMPGLIAGVDVNELDYYRTVVRDHLARIHALVAAAAFAYPGKAR